MGSAMGFCMEAMMDIEMIKAVGGGVPLSTYYRWQYSIERWAVGLNELPDGELPLVHSVSYGDDEVSPAPTSPTRAAALFLQHPTASWEHRIRPAACARAPHPHSLSLAPPRRAPVHHRASPPAPLCRSISGTTRPSARVGSRTWTRSTRS
eukprot:1557392-Prymnesium_polylepis.1